MKSWRTTIMGALALLAVLSTELPKLLDDKDDTNPNWELVATALATGVGLAVARDNKVTSEQAGAKPAG